MDIIIPQPSYKRKPKIPARDKREPSLWWPHVGEAAFVAARKGFNWDVRHETRDMIGDSKT